MARRMHSTDPEAPDPYEGVPSRGARRKEQHEVTSEMADLGLALAALSPAVRAKLELPDGLEQALRELADATKGARVRQRRFVARQLRSYDGKALAHAVALLDPSSPVSLARAQLIERWRDRLMDARRGDEGSEEFLTTYASAERQTLRQLVRSATKEAGDTEDQAARGKSASAKRRALYQYIRECIAAADPRPTALRPSLSDDALAADAADTDDDSDDESD
jgi:ribosome-associated protein